MIYLNNKQLVKLVLFLCWALILILSLLNMAVFYFGSNSFDHPYQVSNQYTAIVLGAKVKNGKPSAMLKDRLDTAIKLYDKLKVKKLLLTGARRSDKYDEVAVMEKYVTDHGVSKKDVLTDRAGYSTYNSIYRAKKRFKIKRAVIVTQEFHLKRSLFIAESIGMKAEGLVADRRQYGTSLYLFTLREYFANIKAVGEVVIRNLG